MSLQTFTHNPTPVEAIRVEKPWKRVKDALPFAHPVNTGSGALAYFRVTSATGEGPFTTKRAYPGNWIVKLGPATYDVLSDDDFQYLYGKDADGDGSSSTE